MKLKLWVILCWLGVCGNVYAQSSEGYVFPLKIPISLSANFGELRPDHFHSGIDFRTNGQEGIPVYAVNDGYISRIAVLPRGFGNALYILHSDGNTSVYAHLQRFVPNIAQWVKQRQYKNQAFVFDAEIKPDVFRVQRGELIGYSGNSGGSMGAHLHFELRSLWQTPFNPISRRIYPIIDTIEPHAQRLYVYQMQSAEDVQLPILQRSLALKKQGKIFRLAGSDTLEIGHNTFFGLDMLDSKNGSQSTFGIYSVQIKYNDSLCYAWTIDHFTFDETRYANAVIDYSEYVKTGNYVYRLYKSRGNYLSIFNKNAGSGLLQLPLGGKSKVDIFFADDSGNMSWITFWVKNTGRWAQKNTFSYAQILHCNVENTYLDNDLKLWMPEKALYESCALSVQKMATPQDIAPQYIITCQPSSPPHKPISVSLKANVPERLRDKVALVNTNERGKRQGRKAHRDGKYYTSTARYWGTMDLVIDTTPPIIRPLRFTSEATQKYRSILFRVVEETTDLKTYAGYIDNQWALFEYDEKRDRIIYNIDYQRVTKGTWHTIRFVAEDQSGNVAEFNGKLFF
ncbi:peptidase M23 [Bacteroidia bacterium]|nr:peptidase M23 [Bacteroidia bacterium]